MHVKLNSMAHFVLCNNNELAARVPASIICFIVEGVNTLGHHFLASLRSAGLCSLKTEGLAYETSYMLTTA